MTPPTTPVPHRGTRPRRSLVVRLDSLGDLVLAGPAIRAVARTSTVTLLCGRRGTPLAPLLPGVSDVIEFRAPWIADDRPALDRGAVDDLVDRLAGERFDEAIVLTSARQSCLPTALVLKMAGIPSVVGLTRDSPGSLLDAAIRSDLDVHEVERALAIAALAGHVPAPDDTALSVRRSGREQASAGRLPDRYVVVHPGATVPARTLSPVAWRAATVALVDAGVDVVLTGTGHETESLADLPVTDLGGRTELPALVEVLGRADAVCVGNTGVMHLAAAVATPVCAVFPPTVAALRWRPWRVPHVLLGDADVPCAGCHATSCPLPTMRCVADVTPDDLVGAVRSLVATGAEVPA